MVKSLWGWETRAEFKFRDEACNYAHWLRKQTRLLVQVEAL